MQRTSDDARARETAAGLRGVIGFPVTPFNDDEEQTIDWDSFRAHIETLASSGLTALVVAGGTGEFFGLTAEEVRQLAAEATDIAAGRTRILIGVGASVAAGRQLATAAYAAGADGVLVLPPYYPSPDRDALVAYYSQIAASVPDLAVVPYSRGAAQITPNLLERLAEVPNITAFKDGHGDVRMFLRNRHRLGDRFVWLAGTGDDLVGPYAAAGAEGFTSSVACFDPPLALELWRLAASGRFAELDELSSAMIRPWYELRTRRPGFEVSVMKEAMTAYGFPAGTVRPPLAPLSDIDRADVHEIAARIGRFIKAEVQIAPA